MLRIKNPHFLPNFYGTLAKRPSHKMIILANCHQNWGKIVDFLLTAYFWAGGQFRLYILYRCANIFFTFVFDTYKIVSPNLTFLVLTLHKRWICPISTFQNADIDTIHNFIPLFSCSKWKLKSIFSPIGWLLNKANTVMQLCTLERWGHMLRLRSISSL